METGEVNMLVWVPDDKDGFILCKIIDISSECLTLQRYNEVETVWILVRIEKRAKV